MSTKGKAYPQTPPTPLLGYHMFMTTVVPYKSSKAEVQSNTAYLKQQFLIISHLPPSY